MRAFIELYSADRHTLEIADQTPLSPAVHERMRKFYLEWQNRLHQVPFHAMDQHEKVDYLLLSNELSHQLDQLTQKQAQENEAKRLVPFAPPIVDLIETLRRLLPVNSQAAAKRLADVNHQIEALKLSVAKAKTEKYVANRAATEIDQLRTGLKSWFEFYNSYDPVFTWWVADTYKTMDASLEEYAALIREDLVGIKRNDKTTIIGNPIGRESLMHELSFEMIPYSPEELLALADREFRWCQEEGRHASRALGYGDDWLKALEKVKSDFVAPGEQPQLIRQLYDEAVKFVKDHNLITIPELAEEGWRMEMMTPERQLINPFFSGGETMSVSYPTSGMTYEQKMMSMRGNNRHFARATVFHELIPGHELQLFVADRARPYRRVFTTPFYVEGWALYWEMLLWDMNFASTPEDRIGMLFWRMHRAARILFSLNFHLGNWTAQQCIDFLITRVGHEPENAIAEVRRSFIGQDPPLYQAAYMLGGLQLRALRKELVDSGRMSNREFHDAVLQENAIPVSMVRAELLNLSLNPDRPPVWRFYGDLKQ